MSKLGDVVFCVDCDRTARRREGALSGALSDALPDALPDVVGGAVNGEHGAAPAPPRRMAVKKDANGDRLCAQCLDARRSNRNAAFLLQERRAQFSSEEAGSNGAPNGEAPARPRILRIASAVRITRPAVAQVAPVAGTDVVGSVATPRAARKTEPAAIRTRGARAGDGVKQPLERAHKREPVAKSRARERAFVQLAAEIGLVRTRLLLDKLKKNLRVAR